MLYRFPQVSQTFVRDEVWGLRSRGLEVDVIGLDAGDPAVDEAWAGPHRRLMRPSLAGAVGAHAWFAFRYPRRYLRYLAALARLRDRWRMGLFRAPAEARLILSRCNVSRCHTHFAWTTAAVAVYLAELLGVPVSITVHAKDIYTAKPKWLAARLRRFDDVLTVCQYNVGYLAGRRATPFGDPRVQVVPCCVELPSRTNTERDTDVVAVGRFIPKKGLDTLLEAAASLLDTYPTLTVRLVGDGPERQALEELATRLGLRGNVRFTGALPHKDTLEEISRARVFCLPARPAEDGDSDAMPVVLREAMAREVPVIATRLAGIPESVDSEVGWLVAPNAPGQVADALREALSDPDRRVKRGRAARDRVARYWTPEVQASILEEVFARRGDDQLA